MSSNLKPGKRAIIWEQDFYGNPIVAGLSISDQGRLFAIIIRMGAADSPEITDEIIAQAARQCREKPSRLRGTLAKCGAIFDRREDGTLYSSKLERAIADRERKQGGSAKGSKSGQKTGLKTGSNWGRNADELSSESPSKSRQTEPDFRRPPVQEEEKASLREERLEVHREKPSSVSLSGGAPLGFSAGAALSRRSSRSCGDPLEVLVAITGGRASSEDWTKGLIDFERLPAEAVTLFESRNGGGAELLARFEERSGTALVRAILNELTSAS